MGHFYFCAAVLGYLTGLASGVVITLLVVGYVSAAAERGGLRSEEGA